MVQTNSFLSTLRNPFTKIAGMPALLWGFTGIVISTVMCIAAPLHYHGLLHYGPAPDNAWWCFAAEQLIVWLIPSLLFLIAGKLFSPSRPRIIDIFGTIAFAQLPFLLMNLFFFSDAVQKLMNISSTVTPEWIMQHPEIMKGAFLMLPSSLFAIWVLVWMYNAVKVSCNLKGKKLAIIYAAVLIISDIICRQLIQLMY